MTQETESKLYDFCQKQFRYAYEKMEPFHKEWLRNYNYFNGKPERKRPDDKHWCPVNLIQPLIQQSIAYQTTVHPTVRFDPLIRDDKTVRACDFLNTLYPCIHDELWMTNHLSDGLFLANMCRVAFLERYYDPFANQNMGGYRLKARDPFTAFPDPNCNTEDIQNDSNIFFTAEKIPMSYIRRYWPDRADEAKNRTKAADVEDYREQRFGANRISDADSGRYSQLVDSSIINYTGTLKLRSDEVDPEFCTLYRMWIKEDYAEHEYSLFKRNAEGFGEWAKRKINTRWRVISYLSSGMILSDENSPFWDGELGFVRMAVSSMPGSIMGPDEMGQLIPLQNTYNWTWSILQDYLERLANPYRFVSSGSGIETAWLSNFWRRVWPVKGSASQAVYTDTPPNLGPEVMSVLAAIPRLMENIIAQPEILQGIRPSGVKSGKALQTLTANAMPRTTKKTLRFEECIKELAMKVMLDYLSGMPAVVERMVGEELVRFYPHEYLDLQLKVEVVPGSSLPNYADQKIEKMVNLFTSMQGMDPQQAAAILQNSDIAELREAVNNPQQPPPGLNVPPGATPQQMQPQAPTMIPFAQSV